MVARTLKRLFFFVMALAGIGLALTALFLLTQTVQKTDDFDRLQGIILPINVAGGILLIGLLVVFYFSMQFINRGIDSWFNVQVEEGLDNALTLSRAALEQQKRINLRATQEVARRLALLSDRQLVFELSLLRRESGASEITLYGDNNTVLATSSDSATAKLPKLLTKSAKPSKPGAAWLRCLE